MNLDKEISSVKTNSQIIPKRYAHPAVEVVVIEDNRLINMVMSNALASTIYKIQNLKNIHINFSCFHLGRDFLNYFENIDLSNSKLIVFSDYFLEDEMNGGQILKIIKQKKADANVIIVSDTTDPKISAEVEYLGACCFIPKSNKAPVYCSEILFQKVV